MRRPSLPGVHREAQQEVEQAERAAMGKHNRERVLQNFTHDRCIAQYEALYERLLSQ